MNDIEQLNSLFYCLYCTSVPLHSQSWPGLPSGVEFNPSDSDLLWHVAAEVGNAIAERHPFINEFIKFVDDVREFICTHPQHIPGVRQDGRASYFFHRSFEPYINENDVNNCWKKIGSHRSIILDGTLTGCKEVFALYADMPSDKRSQETDWRLHQYHLQ
uniref:NAC domain-containing protein n=1 Tax=Zea mays TaxID=4577 RepID=A0A804QP94_MAIZE